MHRADEIIPRMARGEVANPVFVAGQIIHFEREADGQLRKILLYPADFGNVLVQFVGIHPPVIKIVLRHRRMIRKTDFLESEFQRAPDIFLRFAARHSWDYFIGSVHYVSDSWAVDDPQKLSEWKHRNANEVWAAYFERLTKAAETGFFEIIGHADLPKKFGHRPDRDPGFAEVSCTPLYEKFLNAAKKNNCAIELNTAGLRKDCKEIYPNREILQLAFQKGVPITFGSDAHAPAEVGMNFAEAIQLARSVGYKESCQFVKRRRQLVKF